jgi:uncharacterized OB-fold protein
MGEMPRLYSPYDEPMWQSVAEGALKLQRCAQCGRFRYPPGPCCPACLSTEARWEAVSGRGRVLSWTTFHRQYLPAYPPPLTCVAVALEEGPIVIANVDADDAAALTVFPEMDDTADVTEITEACWGILDKSPDSVMCASSRMVVKYKRAPRPTVIACTLLPYDARFDLGATLQEAMRPVALNHPHCAKFCVLGGGACSRG